MVERIRIDVTPSEHVTAIAYSAAARDHAGISLILAHGAGANQTSSFMVHFASRSRRGESTLSLSTSCTAKKPDAFRTGTTSWKRAGGR